jgi:hypothetical protein
MSRKPTIALCMIVRDEEQVITRCLRSVRSLIDRWVICDTGSSDATVARIERMLAGIPGELHERPWVDFGHNRSELLELARGTADYLLLLDADQALRLEGELPELEADAYLLRETGQLDFAVPRLVRGDRNWWYVGATHEYLATDGQFDQQPLDELRVDHFADGAARPDKLLRDLGLLKRAYADDPGAPRTAFYLAQTYRDLGRRGAAIQWYRRRVELGGWEEEVFYANLQEGILRADEDFPSSIPVLLEAWGRRPSRAEPLYELARRSREHGNLAAAHLFAGRGLELPYPDDILFVHRWVYEWGLGLEHAVAADHLGYPDEAEDDLRQLLQHDGLPPTIERFVHARLDDLGSAYAGPVPQGGERAGPDAPLRLVALAPSTRIGEIRIDVEPAWPPFNPSIAADGDGFALIVRTANYRIRKGVLHADGVLRNINYRVALGPDLAVREIEVLDEPAAAADTRRYPSEITGFEDCRLIEVDGRWYATATTCEFNPINRREIALLALDGAEITAAHALEGPEPGRHEKNWMPFTIGGELHIVYSLGPTVVYRCDPASGTLTRVAEHDAPALASSLRGGSQGVRVEGGVLFAAHRVTVVAGERRYIHHLVLLGDDLRLEAISPPFTFTADPVEFCAGMARRGDELVLSFGVSDVAAGLAVVSLDEALALLAPVSPVTPTSELVSESD